MMNIEFRSDIDVELVSSMASDEAVVFAARVSSQGANVEAGGAEGLINFLARERHGSPFEHCVMTFRVTAPIFVWREHMRHRMASYNEESGRYKVLDPVFYVPDDLRPLVQIGKVGAYIFRPGTITQTQVAQESLKNNAIDCYSRYCEMIEMGIAKEVARMALPVSIYSTAYVTMNARALMNFLSLRRSVEGSAYPSYPQQEIEMVAEKYEAIFKELMPLTHAAFEKNGRVSP